MASKLDVCTFIIKINGTAINYPALNISISNELNRIPTATLTLLDNNPKTIDLETNPPAIFNTGNTIDILASYNNLKPGNIFSGIIVRQSMKITSGSASIEISCKHKAVAMTVAKKDITFKLLAENTIIDNILSTYSLDGGDVATMPKEDILTQKSSTDWDFILLRAETYGYVVMCNDKGVNILSPALNTTAVLDVMYGVTLMSFNCEIDAEKQLPYVKVRSWNAETQAMVAPVQGVEPAIPMPGGINWANDASKINSTGLDLTVTTSMAPDAMQKWADSLLLRMRLGSYKGTLSCYGNAVLLPGSVISVTGVGPQFSGDVFISSVTHSIVNGLWKSDVKIGMDAKPAHEKANMNTPPAAGQLPAVNGLQIAKVKQLSKDPDSLFKILVEFPTSSGEGTGLWARLSNFYATKGGGLGFLPEIDDEVVVGFLDSDPRSPIILGSMYSKNLQPLNTASDEKNNLKTLSTRSLLKISFDDDKKTLKIETPGNNSIFLNDEGKTIEIKDQNGNIITMNDSSITLTGSKDITIKASGDINLTATGKVNIEAQKDVGISGMNVNLTAKQAFTAKGNATSEVTSTGQTTIKGAMVMIN